MPITLLGLKTLILRKSTIFLVPYAPLISIPVVCTPLNFVMSCSNFFILSVVAISKLLIYIHPNRSAHRYFLSYVCMTWVCSKCPVSSGHSSGMS